MANKKIQEIEGIGPTYGEKLAAAGIADSDALLERGCTKAGRKEIAEGCGISEKQVLGWVNMADLFRIKGVGPEFAELLEAAGVDTVKELAQRNAESLAGKITDANESRKLTRQVPSATVLGGWIDEAKGLPRKVEY